MFAKRLLLNFQYSFPLGVAAIEISTHTRLWSERMPGRISQAVVLLSNTSAIRIWSILVEVNGQCWFRVNFSNFGFLIRKTSFKANCIMLPITVSLHLTWACGCPPFLSIALSNIKFRSPRIMISPLAKLLRFSKNLLHKSGSSLLGPYMPTRVRSMSLTDALIAIYLPLVSHKVLSIL